MITEILHQAFYDEDRQRKEYRPAPHLAGKCPRQLTYRRMGIEGKPMEARAFGIFAAGDLFENWTVDGLTKTLFETQQFQLGQTEPIPIFTLSTGQTVTGRPDLLLTDPTGAKTIVEIKSISPQGFEALKEPIPEHVAQIQCYLHGLRDVTKNGLILYVDKGSCNVREFPVVYDPVAVARIQLVFEDVEKHFQDKTLPSRPYQFHQRTEYPCSYCPYIETCFANYEDEFNELEHQLVTKDPELDKLCQIYLEAQAAVNEEEGRLEIAKKRLHAYLDTKDAASVVTNIFYLERKLSVRHAVDQKLLPPEVKAAVMRQTKVLSLAVRKHGGGSDDY